MKIWKITVSFVFLISTLSGYSQNVGWKILDDYEIHFDGSGAEGTFRGLAGTIVFDPEQLPASGFDVTIDVSTISTGNDTKDGHATGEKWFDESMYPKIRFKTTEIVKADSGYLAKGMMSIHGFEKKTSIPFNYESTGPALGFLRAILP